MENVVTATLRKSCAMVLAMALAGCAVTPDYHPPAVDVPPRWSESTQSAMPAASAEFPWWRSFNDPQLDSLVGRALRANVDLQLAAARIREARARGGAAASLWPSVDATASFVRERESRNEPNPVLVRSGEKVESPGRPENIFRAGFDASWEIDIFGGTRRTMEAAESEFQSAVYERGAVILTLVAEVSRTYFELQGARRQSRIARETLVAQQQTLDLVQARYAAGMATGLDVARAEAQLQRTASQLQPLETTCKRAIHRLAVLTGEPLDTLAAELHLEREIPTPTAEPPLGLPSDLLRQRPDIRSAERGVAAAAARLGAATADLYPKFSLLGRAGLASVAAADFFNADSAFWSVGPSISWPILQGGRIKAIIKVRDAQLEQALISYRRAILNGIEDVENAASTYQHEKTRRGNLVKAVSSEERAAAFARERYASGLTDFRDVLDAQRSLFEAQSELSRSETLLLLDLVALYKALGGGWNVPVPADQESAQRGEGGAK